MLRLTNIDSIESGFNDILEIGKVGDRMMIKDRLVDWLK